MAKTEEANTETVDKSDTPCIMCGSTDWCDCEWDSFAPPELVAMRRTYKVEYDESLLMDMEEATPEKETEDA